MTLRLPDDKHERLKALARANAISVNKLIDELATVALANYDARVRFEVRAACGSRKRALALLAKFDRAEWPARRWGDIEAMIRDHTHSIGADLALDTSGAPSARVSAIRALKP